MELNEVGRRIIGQHWLMIFVFLVLGVGAAIAIHSRDVTTYTASSRMVLGADDPKTSSESLAISDTAWAIATAPTQLREALRRAGVPVGDLDVAAKRVNVAAVGASGVLDISFRDENPLTAVAVADSLAEQLRHARADAGHAELRELLADIDARIAKINRKLLEVSAGSRATPAETGLRDSLNQQRAVLETQRVSALFEQSRSPSPSIVSQAAIPTTPDSTGAVADVLLAAVLGLVLGTGLAAMLETFRPTLVGGEALARELDAPLLGTLSTASADALGEEASAVSWRLRMATRAAGVSNVALVPVRRDQIDVAGLGEALVGGELRSFDIRNAPAMNGSGSGVVILASESIMRSELDELRNLLRVTPGHLLGVITYRRSAPSRTRRHREELADRRVRRARDAHASHAVLDAGEGDRPEATGWTRLEHGTSDGRKSWGER